MFISKTGLSQSVPVQDSTMPGYSPILTKDHPLNREDHSVYATDRDTQNEDLDFPFMCFRVALVYSMSFVFPIY